MRNDRAHQVFRIITIFVYCLLSGCSDEIDSEKINQLSASACAKKLSDGSIVECETPNETDGKYGSVLSESIKINKLFPGPEGPLTLDISKDQLHRVTEIGIDAGIRLENGMRLKLAGLECDSEKVANYLKDVFLQSNEAKLYFRLTGHESNQYKYAYIWEVDLDFGENDSGIGARINIPNEAVLVEGWCKPIPQENHRFLERYKRVAALGS